ncbi:hypothetical protein [Aestuariimicrobium sp. Y1814]|uniref:hypothetical protein n=1 Tax=Aestuariimicrobium sp. Y1814 TaxID=3418742 RepID=UPI003DA750EE
MTSIDYNYDDSTGIVTVEVDGRAFDARDVARVGNLKSGPVLEALAKGASERELIAQLTIALLSREADVASLAAQVDQTE